MSLLRWPKVACGPRWASAFDGGEPKGCDARVARVGPRGATLGRGKRTVCATFVPLTVEVQRRVRTWAPPRADIAAWASTALGRKAAGRELGVRVVGPTE